MHNLNSICLFRFKAKSAPAQSGPNSNGQASTFKSAAGTAAGVAVGSVVVSVNINDLRPLNECQSDLSTFKGQVIGSKIVGRASSVNAESRDSAEMQELCVPEIREFFECASTTENLDTCKAFHNTWMKCQNKYKHCEN